MKTKPNFDELTQGIVMERGKDLCDLLKVKILDSLIKLSEQREAKVLFSWDLEAIRDGIEDLRGKEKEEQVQAIVKVFERVLERGNADAQIKRQPE